MSGRDDVETAELERALNAANVAVHADSASLVLKSDGEVSAAWHSDELAAAIDGAAIAARSGPVFEAMAFGTPIRVQTVGEHSRWPVFGDVCAAHHVRSAMIVPITSRGECLGTLNVYSRDYFAFGVDELRTGMACAEEIGLVLATR